MVSWDTSLLSSTLLGCSPKGFSWPSLWNSMARLDNIPGTMGFAPHRHTHTHTRCDYVASCSHSYRDLVGSWRERMGWMACNVSGLSIKWGSVKVLWGLASFFAPEMVVQSSNLLT